MQIEFIGMSGKLLNSVPKNKHDFWEILFYLEGEGTLTIGDDEYAFKPKQIICQPPNVLHCENSEGGFRNIYLQIKDYIPPNDSAVPIFFDLPDKSFEKLILMAFDNYHKKEENYEAILNALCDVMYQLLISWSTDTKTKNVYVEEFKHILLKNITNTNFDICSAIAKTNYCNGHFRRSFKHSTGTTPTAYFINLRVEYAKKLLDQQPTTKLTIKGIAKAAGFSDPYYFSRIFKSKTGKSPMEYLRNN